MKNIKIRTLAEGDAKDITRIYAAITQKTVGKENSNSMLISGYLDAIKKFETALDSSEDLSQTVKLEYKQCHKIF